MSSADQQAEPRCIDLERGALGGIGAQQRVGRGTYSHGGKQAAPAPYDVWPRKPSADSQVRPADRTYYDRPAIKEPVWIWSVPAYFYIGGTSGAASLLGAVASYRAGLEGLERACRWLAAAGDALGTGLLIIDLGRPARFLNMLRVFRPTSPMSVGSWVLALSSGLSALSALTSRREGAIGRVGDAAGQVAGLLGVPLAGYSAVLVTNTAVPAWQGARRTLPLLFAASGVAGAASLLDLLDLDEHEVAAVRVFGVAGGVGELLAGRALEREVGQVERAAHPYHEGLSGLLWKAAKVATAASLFTSLLPGASRPKRALAGLLGTAGSLSLRFAVFHAGRRSARDPRATFHQQRAGHGAAEVTHAAAVTGPDGRRATG
ncbi:MAG: polysulfide reductase NrfD [Actinomycetota bacterium]|nr:polysulfide reductase NrfD [Actinomycetota bacterium]